MILSMKTDKDYWQNQKTAIFAVFQIGLVIIV